MSLKFRDSSGVETPVAGLNGTSGELVPSVALYQSKNFGVTFSGSDTVTVNVTLGMPMPDGNYLCTLSGTFGNEGYINAIVTEKTTTTVTVKCTKVDGSTSGTYTLNLQAFKLMTDTVHEADAAHIAQNTANFAPAFSEVTSYAVGDYVTYNNVLYRCTTAHTAGTWVSGHFTQVTVGGDLTRNTTFSSKVTLDAYNSSSNQYTFPRDGYLYVFADSTGNNATTRFSLIMDGDAVDVKAIQSINSVSASQVMFVKKGMKGYVSQRTDSTYCHVWYYPVN